MIPTLLVFGAVFGRWWRSTLVIGTVGWVIALLVGGVIGWSGAAAAAVLGFGNTAVGVGLHQVGVGLHQAVLRGIRTVRRSPHPPTTTAS